MATNVNSSYQINYQCTDPTKTAIDFAIANGTWDAFYSGLLELGNTRLTNWTFLNFDPPPAGVTFDDVTIDVNGTSFAGDLLSTPYIKTTWTGSNTLNALAGIFSGTLDFDLFKTGLATGVLTQSPVVYCATGIAIAIPNVYEWDGSTRTHRADIYPCSGGDLTAQLIKATIKATVDTSIYVPGSLGVGITRTNMVGSVMSHIEDVANTYHPIPC